MLILNRYLALRRAYSRVAEARCLADLAQRISASQRTNEGEPRIVRLYRRALQRLDLVAPNPGPQAAPESGREAMKATLNRRLEYFGFAAWLRRYWATFRRRVELALVASLLVLTVLLATTPRFRRLFFPIDLADGRAWTASTALPDYSTRGLVELNRAGLPMFHTVEEQSPWLVVDLGRTRNIHEVRVMNRSDCCFDRALPLAAEISTDGGATWRRVAYRRLPFTTWRATFPTIPARLVRLRVDRPSALHLALVSVY